jgi:uracil-DNA glycosylase family 4
MPSLYQVHSDNWINCQRCELHKTRKHVVLYRGRIPCEVLFIGEAPGESEDVLGLPFVGPAGHLLDHIIHESLPNGIIYALTNLLACIPRDPDDTKADPQDSWIKKCAPRLREFISLSQPQLIVKVGSLANDYVKTDIRSVSITHPAAILRANIAQRGLAIQRCVVTIVKAIEQFKKGSW